jgi:hypothetical protein
MKKILVKSALVAMVAGLGIFISQYFPRLI